MQYVLRCALLSAIVALGACAGSPSVVTDKSLAVATGKMDFGRDYHSFANPQQARVSHVELDLKVDFERRQLIGSALLTVAVSAGAQQLVLDTRDLHIDAVRYEVAGAQTDLKYTLDAPDPNLGSALRIALPAGPPTMFIRVIYATSPQASGLQWLSPAQTAGKKRPFLFTQSQAIHARSWIPLQDTPAVRMTYSARVRTEPDLLAVMSASNEIDTPRDGDYSFSMPQPIPSYLIALGVGDLQFQAMSERTGVYAEAELLAAAAAEFEDTQAMLDISEGLYGPYRWGRYDLLILPPSFPFGGMENPRLSFITPTVIAGDKSLVSLIAHELAHSWSGNLVTNATWRDLWLNEGFTSFLTSRIMEAVYGEQRATMEYFLDYQALRDELRDDLPPADQILAIDLRGRDPDDSFSGVPYTKGQLFLTWLEQRFGRQRFDAFLRDYFDAFAFSSVTTDEFLAFLQERLIDVYPNVVDKQAIHAWVFEPGLPADAPVIYSDAFEKIDAAMRGWLDGTLALGAIDTAAWSVHEWLYFVNNLPQDLSLARMTELDQAFGLTASPNNEIAHSWLLQSIRHGYTAANARLSEYLVAIGRRKLIVPLYKELAKSDAGMAFARRVYRQARPGYHPLAVSTVDDILKD